MEKGHKMGKMYLNELKNRTKFNRIELIFCSLLRVAAIKQDGHLLYVYALQNINTESAWCCMWYRNVWVLWLISRIFKESTSLNWMKLSWGTLMHCWTGGFESFWVNVFETINAKYLQSEVVPFMAWQEERTKSDIRLLRPFKTRFLGM